jgi:hypothetical protein
MPGQMGCWNGPVNLSRKLQRSEPSTHPHATTASADPFPVPSALSLGRSSLFRGATPARPAVRLVLTQRWCVALSPLVWTFLSYVGFAGGSYSASCLLLVGGLGVGAISPRQREGSRLRAEAALATATSVTACGVERAASVGWVPLRLITESGRPAGGTHGRCNREVGPLGLLSHWVDMW